MDQGLVGVMPGHFVHAIPAWHVNSRMMGIQRSLHACLCILKALV